MTKINKIAANLMWRFRIESPISPNFVRAKISRNKVHYLGDEYLRLRFFPVEVQQDKLFFACQFV